MNYKDIEKLQVKFSPDTKVFLFEGINNEVTAGTEGVVLHVEPQHGIYVYFKILGNTSTRFFKWDELINGKLRTKEEWDKLSRESWYDNQFTSSIIQMQDIDTGKIDIQYVHGFRNSDMIDEFLAIINRRHWFPVWSGSSRLSVATSLAKLKSTSDAEVTIRKSHHIEDVLKDFRRVINLIDRERASGSRPDTSPADIRRCISELSNYIKKHKEFEPEGSE